VAVDSGSESLRGGDQEGLAVEEIQPKREAVGLAIDVREGGERG